MKLSDRFFKNRVKPIAIAQLILVIPLLIIVILTFTSNTVRLSQVFVGVFLAPFFIK